MARRVRSAITISPDDAKVHWEALSKWIRWLSNPPIEPQSNLGFVDALLVSNTWSQLDEADTTDEARIEQLSALLGKLPWPWAPGENNPAGFRTFADSADAHVARCLRKRKEAA
jgi:hypothetical protein